MKCKRKGSSRGALILSMQREFQAASHHNFKAETERVRPQSTNRSIPGQFQNFTIKAEGPAGIEKLKSFATEANVPLLPEQYNVSAFRSLDPKTEGSVTRDLSITINGLNETAWAEGSFEFQVREKAAEKRP